MRAAVLLLAAIPVWGQVTTPASMTATSVAAAGTRPSQLKISRATFTDLEKSFDGKLRSAGGDDPLDLWGLTRGLYLEGYGAVFTAEVQLVVTPGLMPLFQQKIPPEVVAKIHQRKLEHMALLKGVMREMMASAAATLFVVPADQKIVVAVRLLYHPWEDTSGLPGQILMKADRTGAMSGHIEVEEQ